MTRVVSDKAKVLAIIEEGYEERLYQARRWANGDVQSLNDNDDLKIDRPESWTLFMMRYMGTWNDYTFPYQYNNDTLISFRKAMIKTMMLSIAAIMWVDRRLGRS